MKKTTLNISTMDARRIALNEAGVDTGAFLKQKLLHDVSGSLYELDFITDEMAYTCYVDANGGEVLGFSYEPFAA